VGAPDSGARTSGEPQLGVGFMGEVIVLF
jgi:hypothetical protein